jgi:zinc protease
MIRLSAAHAATLFCVAVACPAAAQVDATALARPLPLDPQVVMGTLPNGIRYYVRANGRPERRAELRLVVNAGSVLEDDDQLGLAHVVEHMAFNGTEHFAKQELVDYMERVGMRLGPHLNAYTSFDETVYMLRVPTDTAEVLETAIQILEDWAHGVSFDSVEIENERAVVVEEWRLGRGADARLRDKQFPIIFMNSRYADRLPIGTKESLETFDVEALRRFYREWYRPDLMAIVAVGDFESATVEQLIREHFGRVAVPTKTRPRSIFAVPDHDEPLVAATSDPETTTSSVGIYYKQPRGESGTVGAYRERLVARLYDAMFNARLNEITQQPDAPFLFGSFGQGQFVRSKDVYVLFAGVRDGGVEEGLAGLLTEAERVARHGFTGSELEREKVELVRWMERGYAEREKQNSSVYASRYVQHFLTEAPVPGIATELELTRLLLPTIGLDEVHRLVETWITDRNRVIVASAPEKPDTPLPSSERLLGVFDVVESSTVTPYEDVGSDAPLLATLPARGRVVAEERVDEVGLTIWTLANGARVLLKPTDFKDDEVLLRASSPGGHSLASDEDFLSAVLADEVIARGGAGELDRVQLQKRLSGKVASVFPSIGSLSEGLAGSASPRDLETMFQLVYLRFTHPRRDSSAFVAFLQQMEGVLNNRDASPVAAFYDTLAVTMAQGHYRARPFTTELLTEIELDKAFDFYRDRFADASDFTFVLVGNFTVDSIRLLVETYVGGLPSLERIETWRDVGMRPPTGVIRKTVHRGIEPKSQTQIVFTGPFEYTTAERYTIRALASALQLRLREVLREGLGGTYSASVSSGYARDPRAEYTFRINFGSGPDRADELIDAVFDEIESFKTVGPTPADVGKVSEMQRRAKETSLRENGYWASQLMLGDRHGLDPRQLTSFSQIEGVTASAIQAAARRYLRTDNYVLVTLYPES